MPEPGQVRQPEYRQGGSLPYGEASQLNALMGLMPPPEEDDAYQPQGDEESFLFGPTDRPDEPITAGLPFGEGPDVSREDARSDADLLTQVSRLLSERPDAPKEVKAFARRVARGE